MSWVVQSHSQGLPVLHYVHGIFVSSARQFVLRKMEAFQSVLVSVVVASGLNILQSGTCGREGRGSRAHIKDDTDEGMDEWRRS